MKKLFFVLLMCSMGVFAQAAESKIAIIGDSPMAEKTADLALTELSDKKGIAVLERGEIDKLLREHKLARSGMTATELASFARIAHVDIVAVIHSAVKNKENINSSLLVFDAKTGFQLRDVILTGRLDEDVKTISSTVIAASAQLRQTKRITYVAILAIRNAGVPSKYKYNMENIATEVRRRLVAAPNIAVLERSRLGLVLKERKLSKKQYKLLPSTYLLDFEFSQGSSANIVNLKFYIMSTNGKILKKYAYANSLGKTSEVISKITNDLGKWLNKPLSGNISSAKAEAARYYQEFLFCTSQQNFRRAFHKLEAAMALDSSNMLVMSSYDQALYSYVNAIEYPSYRDKIDQQLEAMRMLINHGDYLRQSFLSYPHNAYNYSTLFFSPMAGDYNHFSAAQKQGAQELYNELRPKHLAESDRLKGGYPLTKLVRTTNQLKLYLHSAQRSCNHYLFFYYEEAIKHYFELMPKLLRTYAKFSSYPNCPRFPLIYLKGPNLHFTAALARQLQSPAALATINACKSYSQENIRELGLMWELLRNCAKINVNKKQLKHNLDKYLPLIKSKRLMDYVSAIFCYSSWPGAYKAYLTKTMEMKAQKAPPMSWEKIKSKLLFLKKPDEIAKNITRYQNMLSQWRLARTDTDEGLAGSSAYTLLRMGRALTPPLRSEARQALAILNRPLRVTKVTDIPNHKTNTMQHAVEYQGIIYLLTQDHNHVRILGFNPETTKFKELFKTRAKTAKQYKKDYNTFFVNNDYFVFTYGEKIAVVSRTAQSMGLIGALPEPEIFALAMLNDRIYAVVGNKHQGRTLFSCKLDGSNRETHISVLRRDKRNPLDHGKILDIGGMFADESGQRILLVTGGSKTAGLWSFTPGDRKLSQLVTIPGGGAPGAFALRRGNVIYFSNGRSSCKFFTFDIKSGHSVFLYAFSYSYCPPEHRRWRNFAIKPEYNGPVNTFHRRFYTSHGLLWFDGYRTGMVDLKTGNGLYRVYGLTTVYGPASIFPCPYGRDVYAINEKSVYRISPPPKSGTKEKK